MSRLDLDAFNPEQDTISFRGVDYVIPGTIPLPMIMEAAQYHEALQGAEQEIRAAIADSDTAKVLAVTERHNETLAKIYALCMKLLKIENPDVPDLDLTAEQCGAMLSMMASGGVEVDLDKAILEALAGPEDERRPPARSKTRKHPTGQSGKPSRARSSR